MADPEHLEVLKKGPRVWNEWRRTHREIRPDLVDANLSGQQLSRLDLIDAKLFSADLSNTDLSCSNLSNAHLNKANLSGANLQATQFAHTDLRHANLSAALLGSACFAKANLADALLISSDLRSAVMSRATLTSANLINADLTNADLVDADLRHAKLMGTNFSATNLVGTNLSFTVLGDTNLSDAVLADTDLADIDLRGVVGLEATSHVAPSHISISTIYKSEGKIPEIFLRGCGIPESFITHIPALIAAVQPIQFYSCFISYSSKDEELAQRLHADLQRRGVRCWFAPEDLKIGERFRRRIDEVIRVHDKLLLILSENSVASSWVEKEVETAMESEDEQHRTILFPVRLDDSVLEIKTGWPADVRRTRNIGDFRRWKEHNEYQRSFAHLLDDLKASA